MLLHKPDSSIAVAARRCAGRSSVGAGISRQYRRGGAFLPAILKRLPGIRRRTGSYHPTEAWRSPSNPVFADLGCGATLDVTADDLVSFAIMDRRMAARISKSQAQSRAVVELVLKQAKRPEEVVKPTPSSKSLQ